MPAGPFRDLPREVPVLVAVAFFVALGFGIVAPAIPVFAREFGVGRADASATARTSLREAFANRSYRAALAANLADGWAVLGVRSALVPLFVHDVLHRSPLWTGIGFLVVAAVNGAVLFPAGRYADNLGRKPVLVTGLLFSAVGIALLALLPHLDGYLLGLALFGFGSGCLDVAPAAVVGDVVTGRGGSVFATYQMSSDIGAITGPIVAGRLADSSYGAAFGVTAGVLAAAAAMAGRAPETRRRALPRAPAAAGAGAGAVEQAPAGEPG